MNKIEYSIIIPHKNIPDLLARCVKSIPQNDDLEIIVVDDNSETDIEELFIDCDRKNFQIIKNTAGGGAGAARNIGIKAAKGRQVIFADADDFFTNDFNKALKKYKGENFDIVFFKVESKYCDTLEPSTRGDFINQMIDRTLENKTIDLLKFRRLEPWAKIYSKRLIDKNNLWFDETPAANDLMFSVKAGLVAKSIDVDSMTIYCLTQREGSLAYSRTKEIDLAKIHVIGRVNRLLIKNGKGKYHINIFPYVLNLTHSGKRLFIYEFIKSLFLYRFNYVIIDLFKSIISYIKK